VLELLGKLMERIGEVNEILAFVVAILSIAIYFTPLNLYNLFVRHEQFQPLFGFAFPLIAATLAIVPHELAHRQVARKYGCFSRFYLFPQGFIFTLVLNLVSPFGIFASGFTGISCNPFYDMSERDRISGLTSLAGPATNMVISVVFIAMSYSLASYIPFYYVYVFREVAALSSFVAFFNLIPIGPLDGSKVMKWNQGLWLGVIVLAFLLYFYL